MNDQDVRADLTRLLNEVAEAHGIPVEEGPGTAPAEAAARAPALPENLRRGLHAVIALLPAAERFEVAHRALGSLLLDLGSERVRELQEETAPLTDGIRQWVTPQEHSAQKLTMACFQMVGAVCHALREATQSLKNQACDCPVCTARRAPAGEADPAASGAGMPPGDPPPAHFWTDQVMEA